jgi:hypothetical protein
VTVPVPSDYAEAETSEIAAAGTANDDDDNNSCDDPIDVEEEDADEEGS